MIADKVILVQGFCEANKPQRSIQTMIYDKLGYLCAGKKRHKAFYDFMETFIPSLGFSIKCHGMITYKVFDNSAYSFYQIAELNRK